MQVKNKGLSKRTEYEFSHQFTDSDRDLGSDLLSYRRARFGHSPGMGAPPFQ